MFTVYFTVTVGEALHANESVFVTGNAEQLGLWDPKNAVRLEKSADGHWVATVAVNVETLKFRYFIGYYLEAEPNTQPTLIVSQWETHLNPRFVMPAVEATKHRICRANVNDVFGFHGGREVVCDGWLSSRDQNQILITVQGAALKFYKQKHMHEKYRLKVIPTDLRHREDNDLLYEDDDIEDHDEPQPALPSFSRAQIAALTNELPRYRDQSPNGDIFTNGHDYFVYRTQSVAVEFLGFRVEVRAADETERLLAVGFALPSALHDTFGKTSVPLITTKGVPVGKLYIGYLFVRPFVEHGTKKKSVFSLPGAPLMPISDEPDWVRKASGVSTESAVHIAAATIPSEVNLPIPPQTMAVSYAKHWKKRMIALEVGHRGMGNSYTKLAVARENTLHSLDSAAKNGADYVEFDVHLTKDKVPVIFHDFHVLVNVAKRTPSIEDLTVAVAASGRRGAVEEHELAVKDLKFEQLRLLHLDHVEHEKRNASTAPEDLGTLHYKVTGKLDEAEEHRPFPTLEGAFQHVSEETGFNIEIKYPMEWINGEHECANYFERNEFVDIILEKVFRHAGSRRVVFSSFDPDVCTILSLKQNKYPVLFLCQGRTEKHMDYVDRRTQTSEMAVRFVAGMGMAGVNFHSEDLLRDPSPIQMAQRFGLISFVWGDELVEKSVVNHFKKTLGVDGVIYDRIGEAESRSNVFLLERAMKQALFGPTRKQPSPLPSPRFPHKSFLSTSEVHTSADKCPPVVSTAALDHLDLIVTTAPSTITTNSRMSQWANSGGGMSGIHSSASSSSGISTDSMVTPTTTTSASNPSMRRQHCSFSQIYHQPGLTADL